MEDNIYSLEQFQSYMTCPLQEKLIFKDKVLNNARILSETELKKIAYNDAVKTTISYYYSQIANGETVTIKGLYTKFQETFYILVGYKEEKSILDRPIQETRSRENKDRKKYIDDGFKAIKGFHNSLNKEEFIIAHNYPYRIDFNGFSIESKFDLVREVLNEKTNEKIIELVIYSTSKRIPDEFDINHNLSTTFHHYAFKDIFNVTPDAIVISYISLGKEIYVYRDEKEHRRLLSSLTYFSNSINSDIIYPRQSIACNACPVKNFCDKYQF